MKDDLIKILNFKLKQIKDNINSLNEINEKIENENEELEYIQNAINNFKGEEHGFDIYKFSNIGRETFNKLLMNLSDDVLTKFGTNSCNYDGLIYLINGINNGISLTLTQEQIEAINLFIDKLLEKEKEYQDVITSLNDDKQKLEVKDLDVLSELENKYSLIVENIDDKKYVTEIDEIIEAINYSELSNESAFDILCYLLKYNSEIYELTKEACGKNEFKNCENEKQIDLSKPFEPQLNNENNDYKKIIESRIIEIEQEKEDRIKELLSLTDINDEDNKKIINSQIVEIEQEKEDRIKELLSLTDINDEDNEETVVNEVLVKEEYNPILPSSEKEGYFDNNDLDIPYFDEFENQSIDIVMPNIDLDLPIDDDYDVVNIDLNDNNESLIELEENDEFVSDEVVSVTKNEMDINSFENEKDIIIKSDENIEELVKFFEEYDIDVDDEVNKSLLLKGDVNNYKNIVDSLKELGVLNSLNNDLLIEMLLYSDVSIISKLNDIITNDLSVDSNDKLITTNIIVKTMPSIFIKGENGNYDNFIKNIMFLKECGIDLINLFDFSREVFVADNSFIVNNYEIVSNYDLTVNAYNAKYLLLLPNIASKIDYYVEAVYRDNSENSNGEVFDGLEMIKLYPNKLNTVSDETIKRLRYSSENGLKVFGNNENSLTAEITNLNVNMIDMSENFLKSLFNNEFDIIERKEVEEYAKLVSSNEFVEMKEDEVLNKLNGYKVDMRYFIGNINVSSNKVIRNYNILINNGVDKDKALLFAICYNLVVTKTEYERLKLFVNGLGGN